MVLGIESKRPFQSDILHGTVEGGEERSRSGEVLDGLAVTVEGAFEAGGGGNGDVLHIHILGHDVIRRGLGGSSLQESDKLFSRIDVGRIGIGLRHINGEGSNHMVHFGNRDARVAGIGQVEGTVVEVAPPGIIDHRHSGGHVAGTVSGVLLTLHLPAFRTILITVANDEHGTIRDVRLVDDTRCDELAEVGSGRNIFLVLDHPTHGFMRRVVERILVIGEFQFRIIIQLVAGRRKDSVRIGQGLGRLRNEHGELLDDLLHLGIGQTGLGHIQVESTLVEVLATNHPPGVIHLGNLYVGTVGTGTGLATAHPAFRTVTEVSAHRHDHGAVGNFALGNDVRGNELVQQRTGSGNQRSFVVGIGLIILVLVIPEREFLVIGGVLAGFGQDFLNSLRLRFGFRTDRFLHFEGKGILEHAGISGTTGINVRFGPHALGGTDQFRTGRAGLRGKPVDDDTHHVVGRIIDTGLGSRIGHLGRTARNGQFTQVVVDTTIGEAQFPITIRPLEFCLEGSVLATVNTARELLVLVLDYQIQAGPFLIVVHLGTGRHGQVLVQTGQDEVVLLGLCAVGRSAGSGRIQILAGIFTFGIVGNRNRQIHAAGNLGRSRPAVIVPVVLRDTALAAI